MRHAVFSRLTMPAAERHLLAPPITWAGWPVPQWIAGLSMMGVAIIEFRKTE